MPVVNLQVPVLKIFGILKKVIKKKDLEKIFFLRVEETRMILNIERKFQVTTILSDFALS